MIRIIADYLQTNKRLVIPQLGALLVKEPTREILFSELMRRDDGVLRALLVADGMTELAAQGEIDRLVFEVRHAVEEGREYLLEGLGFFCAGPNATIAFRAGTPLPAEQKPAPEPVKVEPVMEVVEPETKSASEPEVEVVEEAEEPHLTTSAKMNPAPYVKGLSYGKPPKNTDAFTYVDRPQRRGRVDAFLLVAILAVVIALGAIAYGYYHDWKERRAEQASFELFEAVSVAVEGDAPEMN
ncbi:MAG: hypothetical protein IKZ12_06075 [Alistipes sp.]|nr:hypothetical protein [Alistipes sp.]